MHLKMSSGKWRPFCLGLNALTRIVHVWRDIFSAVASNKLGLFSIPWYDENVMFVRFGYLLLFIVYVW